MENFAHVDEGGGPLPSGSRLYAMAAVLSSGNGAGLLRRGLRSALLPWQLHLHHYEESAKRRVELAHTIAEFDFSGAVVVSSATSNTRQEHARARLLCWLLPRLQHLEGVDQVIIESRHGSDRHDRRTGNRLRQSHRITATMRIDHVGKFGDERLWLADFLVGAYSAARLHDQPEPWEILTDSHVIDVVEDPE